MPERSLTVVIAWCDRAELRETLRRNRGELASARAEVIVVDCGGAEDHLASLTTGIELPSLRRIRVDTAFNKCLALNLGASLARTGLLAFLDADVVLRRGFFDEMRASLAPGTFVTVDRVHESAALAAPPRESQGLHTIAHSVKLLGPRLALDLETNRTHLEDGSRSGPGLIVMHRDDFVAVGGMNSDLEGWGWEDLDLVARLKLARGLEHRRAGAVLHLTHGDDVRALAGSTRAATESLNFATCIHNYGLGHFLGTYEDDVATWQARMQLGAETRASVEPHGAVEGSSAGGIAVVPRVEPLRVNPATRAGAPASHDPSSTPDRDAPAPRIAITFTPGTENIPGVDLNHPAQLALIEHFREFHADQPFSARPQPGLRYYFDNGSFPRADALALQFMLRHLRPGRYVAIGAGFAFAAAVDVNDRFLGGTMHMTLIDPAPVHLFSWFKPGDRERVELLSTKLQDVDLGLFAALRPGDILFTTSTDERDMIRILHEILPSLQPGVYIHVHAALDPLPSSNDLLDARARTAPLLARAFLQYNRTFEIVYHTDPTARAHGDDLAEQTSPSLGGGGQSVWLRKTR